MLTVLEDTPIVISGTFFSNHENHRSIPNTRYNIQKEENTLSMNIHKSQNSQNEVRTDSNYTSNRTYVLDPLLLRNEYYSTKLYTVDINTGYGKMSLMHPSDKIVFIVENNGILSSRISFSGMFISFLISYTVFYFFVLSFFNLFPLFFDSIPPICHIVFYLLRIFVFSTASFTLFFSLFLSLFASCFLFFSPFFFFCLSFSLFFLIFSLLFFLSFPHLPGTVEEINLSLSGIYFLPTENINILTHGIASIVIEITEKDAALPSSAPFIATPSSTTYSSAFSPSSSTSSSSSPSTSSSTPSSSSFVRAYVFLNIVPVSDPPVVHVPGEIFAARPMTSSAMYPDQGVSVVRVPPSFSCFYAYLSVCRVVCVVLS